MDFPTTQWTLLALASLDGDTTAKEALAGFFLRYRGPVVRTLQRRGLAESRVEDMAHDFFLSLMESSSLKRADRSRGRFRQFISGALNHFLASDVRYHTRQRRGGDATHVSLETGGTVAAETAGAGGVDEAALDREWALAVFGRALESLAAAWHGSGKHERFRVLRCFLPGTQEVLSHQEAAARLGISDTGFRTELSRIRSQFRGFLREEVAATVASPGDIEDEMQYLRDVLAAGAGISPGASRSE